MQSVFRITVTAGLVGLLMMLSPAQSAIAGAPVPSPVIATNSPVTVGSPSTLLVTNIGFSTYTLNCLAVGATLSFSSGTLTSGGSIASQITAASPGTGVVSCVLIDSNGNTSTPGTTKITFLPAPLPPVITVPSSVAAGSKNVYASVLAPPGSHFNWTISNGTVTSLGALAGNFSGPYNFIQFNAGSSGSVVLNCVEADPAGAVSSPGTATVTIF